MTSTAEAFLIATLTDPNGLLETEVNRAAAAAGITPEQLKAGRRNLAVYTSYRTAAGGASLSLGRIPCIACGQVTSYAEPDHRLHLCPTCTSPVSTWRYEQPEPGRARRKEKVLVAHRPNGWPSTETVARLRTCNSVFERARNKVPFCTDTVVWKVAVTRGKTTASSFWCEADLPAEYRPAN